MSNSALAAFRHSATKWLQASRQRRGMAFSRGICPTIPSISMPRCPPTACPRQVAKGSFRAIVSRPHTFANELLSAPSSLIDPAYLYIPGLAESFSRDPRWVDPPSSCFMKKRFHQDQKGRGRVITSSALSNVIIHPLRRLVFLCEAVSRRPPRRWKFTAASASRCVLQSAEGRLGREILVSSISKMVIRTREGSGGYRSVLSV